MILLFIIRLTSLVKWNQAAGHFTKYARNVSQQWVTTRLQYPLAAGRADQIWLDGIENLILAAFRHLEYRDGNLRAGKCEIAPSGGAGWG